MNAVLEEIGNRECTIYNVKVFFKLFKINFEKFQYGLFKRSYSLNLNQSNFH